jgi:hypothetical protein
LAWGRRFSIGAKIPAGAASRKLLRSLDAEARQIVPTLNLEFKKSFVASEHSTRHSTRRRGWRPAVNGSSKRPRLRHYGQQNVTDYSLPLDYAFKLPRVIHESEDFEAASRHQLKRIAVG